MNEHIYNNKEITDYVSAHLEELYALHKELCLIPAPSLRDGFEVCIKTTIAVSNMS